MTPSSLPVLETYASPAHYTENGSDKILTTPKKLVVFIHGYGADGSDLIGLSQQWRKSLPDADFLSPDAPYPCDGNPFGRQWFGLPDLQTRTLKQGVEEAFPILNHFLDQALKVRGLTDKELILVGFSQGTMMALYTAFMRPHACAGVIGFSGLFTHSEDLSIKSKPPVLLIHGDEDEVIPIDNLLKSAQTLKELKVPVETLVCKNLGHSIDQDGLKAGDNFIKSVFGL